MGLADETVTAPIPGLMWAVAGGKGGVGKSAIATQLAGALGRMGKRVVLIDADLGAANLHTLLGIRIPERTLEDFLTRKVETLDEAIVRTELPNVRLLAGGTEIPALANPNHAQKGRILRALNRLAADVLLIDLGGGTALHTLDFYLSCSGQILVMNPYPTALQNVYAFMKSALARRLAKLLQADAVIEAVGKHPDGAELLASCRIEKLLPLLDRGAPSEAKRIREELGRFQPKLIVNMVRNPAEGRMGSVVRDVASRYLQVDVECVGQIPFDPQVEQWIARMDPATYFRAQSISFRAVQEITWKLLQEPKVVQRVA